MTLDEILADCGDDTEKLHQAFADALVMPAGGPRDVLLTALRHKLGVWPHPDTPVAEVLAYAGTPGLPVGRVLATEEARPERFQRAELIAELRGRAAALGPAANALQQPQHGGMFR